jgi:putative transposase
VQRAHKGNAPIARHFTTPQNLQMPNYRRAWHPGGTYFFTVNLLQRGGNDLLVRHIDLLRDVVRDVRVNHPFTIHGWVVLPDHLHCVIELPQGDDEFCNSLEADQIEFFAAHGEDGMLPDVRKQRGERGIWQRRLWEHLIRDERDFQAHMDYVHINPVKHGLVSRVQDWPYSTFHSLVNDGTYPIDWGGDVASAALYDD